MVLAEGGAFSGPPSRKTVTSKSPSEPTVESASRLPQHEQGDGHVRRVPEDRNHEMLSLQPSRHACGKQALAAGKVNSVVSCHLRTHRYQSWSEAHEKPARLTVDAFATSGPLHRPQLLVVGQE